MPKIQLRGTERNLRLIVPTKFRHSLGDITGHRLDRAAETFDLRSVIVSA